MSAVTTAEPDAARAPLFKLPKIPWPPGTTGYIVRTWIALGLAYYVAFFLELDGASSAGICVLILAQPAHGMVLSKSIYRAIGTIAGVTVAVVLTALFPQDRTMLLAGFAVFMGLQTALGSIFRDFRSYACVLAGYTVAIISVANIDTPMNAFPSAVNRVAAIAVGIAAIGFTNAILATAESSRSLMSKLRAGTQDILRLAYEALDARRPPDAATCIAMSAKLMPLRSEISFATPEKPNGRARSAGGRSALLGLFEMLSAIQAVGAGLQHLDAPSQIVDEGVDIARRALRLQNPEKCVPDLQALALPAVAAGTLSLPEAYVFERLRFMIDTMANVRDGLRSLRMGWWPRRLVQIDVHQDWAAVVFNAFRVMIAIAIVSTLAVWSGLAQTATAILLTAVFVSLGAIQPNPAAMGKAAIVGMPLVVLASTLYSFFIFPFIEGYPLFMIALLPIVFSICYLTKIGMAGAGLIFGVQTIVLIAPANVQTLDPATFVDTATMLAVSGVAIFLSFILVLPVDPAQRRLRLALGVGRALRNALADEKKLEQPRASLHYDRLAQFRTWQGDHTVTAARRKTMKRLVDIGNLGLAVRRTWRALDRARPYIAPETDAQARKILPSLSPEETLDLARDYLAAAKGQGKDAAIPLVHAGAALYATAFVTTDEMRLLKHVELLRRKI